METKFKSEQTGIDVTLYADRDMYDVLDTMDFLKQVTNQTLIKLNKSFGKWPHQNLLIYANKSDLRSMEYSGATVLGMGPQNRKYERDCGLSHELVHSYFGRSVFPATGAASWFDEAVTTLFDELNKDGGSDYYNDYIKLKILSGAVSRVMEEGEYQRYTNQVSYTHGAGIIGHLLFKIDNNQELTYLDNFLYFLYHNYRNSVLSSEDLLLSIKQFYRRVIPDQEERRKSLQNYADDFFRKHVFQSSAR